MSLRKSTNKTLISENLRSTRFQTEAKISYVTAVRVRFHSYLLELLP